MLSLALYFCEMLNGFLFAFRCKYKNANLETFGTDFEYRTNLTAIHFPHLVIFVINKQGTIINARGAEGSAASS